MPPKLLARNGIRQVLKQEKGGWAKFEQFFIPIFKGREKRNDFKGDSVFVSLFVSMVCDYSDMCPFLN